MDASHHYTQFINGQDRSRYGLEHYRKDQEQVQRWKDKAGIGCDGEVPRGVEAQNGEDLCRYAWAMFQGRGTVEDKRQAGELFSTPQVHEWVMGNRESSSFACFIAGVCHQYGYGVVEKNAVRSVELYEQAAKAGSLDAAYALGNCYYHGIGVNSLDYRTAVEWFRVGRAGSHWLCTDRLAACLLQGQGVPEPDPSQAIQLLSQCVEQGGFSQSIATLGLCYMTGLGIMMPNPPRAVQLLSLAAERGSLQGLYNMSHCYTQGIDGLIPQDESISTELLESAASRGHPHSCTLRAILYMENKESLTPQEKRKAGALLEFAANHGDPMAITSWGLFQSEELSNHEAAAECFQRAAENGCRIAMEQLAQHHHKRRDDIFVDENPEAVLYWLTKAVEKEDPHAMFELGTLFETGYGMAVGPDIKAALELYNMAAQRGHLNAFDRLGHIYLHGSAIVEQDVQLALKMFEAGANKGNMECMWKLGKCYQDGEFVPADSEKAAGYFEDAAEKGHVKSKHSLELCQTPSQFDVWLQSFPKGASPEELRDLATTLCDKSGVDGAPDGLSAWTRSEDDDIDEKKPSPSDLVSWDGISIDWLLDYFVSCPEMQAFREFGCRLWFIRNHGIPAVMQRRKIPKGSLIDGIRASAHDSRGGKLVGAPDLFISYTGSYTLKQFVNLLKQLRGQRVWTDIFCVDQFGWNEGDNDNDELNKFKKGFMNDLRAKIVKIANTALLLERFDDLMLTLGKIWVLWEVFATVDGKAKLKVVLPTTETGRWQDSTIIDGAVFRALSHLDAEEATAWKKEDKELILSKMRECDGVVNVNSTVGERMQRWLIQRYKEGIASEKSDPSFELPKRGALVFVFLLEYGYVDEAESLQKQAFHNAEQKLDKSNRKSVDNFLYELEGLASLKVFRQQFEEAEILYRRAWEGYCQELSKDNPKALAAQQELVRTLRALGKVEEAENQCLDLVRTMKSKKGPLDLQTIDAIKELATIEEVLGKSSSSDKHYKEAIAGLLSHLSGIDFKTSMENAATQHAMFRSLILSLISKSPFDQRTGEDTLQGMLVREQEMAVFWRLFPLLLTKIEWTAHDMIEFAKEHLESRPSATGLSRTNYMLFVALGKTAKGDNKNLAKIKDMAREVCRRLKGQMSTKDHPLLTTASFTLAVALNACGNDSEASEMMEDLCQKSDCKEFRAFRDDLRALNEQS